MFKMVPLLPIQIVEKITLDTTQFLWPPSGDHVVLELKAQDIAKLKELF